VLDEATVTVNTSVPGNSSVIVKDNPSNTSFKHPIWLEIPFPTGASLGVVEKLTSPISENVLSSPS